MTPEELAKSPAAKRRFCCTCGKTCQLQETYFPESVRCGMCWVLSPYLSQQRLFLPVVLPEGDRNAK